MKVKYTFEMVGSIKPDINFPLTFQGKQFDFIISEKGFLIGMSITESIDIDKWPVFSQERGAIPTLSIPNMGVLDIAQSLNCAAGFMSFFGLEEIKVDNPKIEWIPENDNETGLLHLSEFKFSSVVPENEENIPFSLIAQSLMVGFKKKEFSPALSFFRHGKNDMKNMRYIEAIYDFYFCLESRYGNGKTKNYQVAKEFEKSTDLIKQINVLRGSKEILQVLDKEKREYFTKKYISATEKNIIESIVSLRGFLHHHNPNHPNSWSIDNQKIYHVDAIYLMYLSHACLWEYFTDSAYEEDILKCYSSQYTLNGFT